MQVRKRNGDTSPSTSTRSSARSSGAADGLDDVDPMRVATRTISGLYDGATTAELDQLSIQTAAELIGEEPQYSRLAARLLAAYIDKEVRGQDIASFCQSIALGHAEGLIGDDTAEFVEDNARKLNDAIDAGARPPLRVLRPAHGLRPLPAAPPDDAAWSSRRRSTSSCAWPAGCRTTPAEALELLPADVVAGLPARARRRCSTPARRTRRCRPATCSTRRATSSTRSTTATRTSPCCRSSPAASASPSPGCAPRLADPRHQRPVERHRAVAETLDSSVAAVNQGGRRKGAACVYLEPWHADIEEFLELRDNTGEDARRTHNLNLANWIPDLFMRRVEADETWSLFDPDEVPELPDLCGDDVRRRRTATAEAAGLYVRQVQARDLYGRMMRTLAQTGNGWMTFKDASNRSATRPAQPGNTRAPVEPVHRDPRGHLATTRRRCATSARSTSAAHLARRRRVDFERLRAHGAHRGAVPRPRDRHQLLPDRRRRRRRTRAGGRSASA